MAYGDDAAISNMNRTKTALLNLLARIHGDKGRYVAEHGLYKAIKDAESKVFINSKILIELRRAEEKFPNYPSDCIHAAAILMEEAGELIQASLDYYYRRDLDKSKIEKEAIQTAAMAFRLLINLDELCGGDF